MSECLGISVRTLQAASCLRCPRDSRPLDHLATAAAIYHVFSLRIVWDKCLSFRECLLFASPYISVCHGGIPLLLGEPRAIEPCSRALSAQTEYVNHDMTTTHLEAPNGIKHQTTNVTSALMAGQSTKWGIPLEPPIRAFPQERGSIAHRGLLHNYLSCA